MTFPEGISISELIDALTSYFSILQMNMHTSLGLWTSGSHASWIFCQKIYWVNGVTVTIQHHNNPDTVEVQKARCVEKWHGQSNGFDNILIQEGRPASNNVCVHQNEHYPAKLLYDFHFSDRMNGWEANANGSVIWWAVYHDRICIADSEYPSSAVQNRNYGMIPCRVVPQRVGCIVGVSAVSTPVQLDLSSKDKQYLLNQCTSLESYTMIYYIDWICWSQ